MDDNTYVENLDKARNGDIDAFAALFEPMRAMIFSAVFRIVGPIDAEDVVMETFLKSWQALPGYRGGASLKVWTARIARNCAIDMLRKRNRREQTARADSDGNVQDPADMPDTRNPDPAKQVANDETARLVTSAMGRLPEEYRLVLQLRYMDGLSYAEIAALAGANLGTVMSRLFYGKRKLKAILAEKGGLQ